MAHTSENALVRFFGGRFGNMVYRNYDGMSVLSRRPIFKDRKWSKAQLACQKRFGKGAEWASKARENPELSAFYESKATKRVSGWNLAISDYLRNPKISEIDLEDYHGQKGDTIKVEAHDRFRVAAVIVTILNSLGFEVESGMAVNVGDMWVYEAKEHNPMWKGGKVIVEARDFPGNRVVKRRITNDERRT
jgi:hypothetical protein